MYYKVCIHVSVADPGVGVGVRGLNHPLRVFLGGGGLSVYENSRGPGP